MARRRSRAPSPVAFLSYVRFDDDYEDGRLTDFRGRLENEVRFQTGDEFPIFQDRNDIRWGESWRERIEESIDHATFLIPIVTPGFFKSSACRAEVERFAHREQELERTDLILPVYYLKAAVFEEPRRRARDAVAKLLAQHQYADWRELRFEPSTSPDLRRAVAQLAVQLVAAIEANRRPPARAAAQARRSQSPAPTAKRAPGVARQGTAQPRPASQRVAMPEPPTHVVDQLGRGAYPTIADAVAIATAGDRILVRPGLYRESIVIDKPLELVGDGDPSDIVMQSDDTSAITFVATIGRVANISVRQSGERLAGVDIQEGRLDLTSCEIVSGDYVAVVVRGAADPRIRRNVIRGGVFFLEGALGTVEDNEISAGHVDGIEIVDGANPVVRRNRIYGNLESGIYVNASGLGLIEDNDIYENKLCGVVVRDGGNPTVRRNRINRNIHQGIWVFEGGLGTFEENDLTENQAGPWDVAETAGEIVRRGNLE